VLEGKKSGAFVIRDNPEKPGAFVLTYKFQSRLINETISRTPASSIFNQGFYLDAAQHVVYSTLNELVEDLTQQQNTSFLCGLRVSLSPGPNVTVPPPARRAAENQSGADVPVVTTISPPKKAPVAAPPLNYKEGALMQPGAADTVNLTKMPPPPVAPRSKPTAATAQATTAATATTSTKSTAENDVPASVVSLTTDV
jgi:hypothetical protein